MSRFSYRFRLVQSWLLSVSLVAIAACGGSGSGKSGPKPTPDGAPGATPDASGARTDGRIGDASVNPNSDGPASSASLIKFRPCPPADHLEIALECGTLSVPEDYSKPMGKHVDIEVTRLKASDSANRIGVLFLNPGGPGVPGDSMPMDLTNAMGFAKIARFDLIGFNPRGTGENTLALCDYSPPPQVASPSDPALDKWVKGFDEACVKKYGAAGLATFSTRNTARDVDEIRKGLGEEQINYLAYSYGTWLGPVYALAYPDHVRAMVIDSTMLPESDDFLLLGRESAQASEKALSEMARTCKADPTCPLAGKEDLVALLDRLLAKAAVKPIATGVTGAPSEVVNQTPDQIMLEVRTTLDRPMFWGAPTYYLAALADVADHGVDGASADSKAYLQEMLGPPPDENVDPGASPDGGASPHARFLQDPSIAGINDPHDAIICADIASRPTLAAFIDNIQAIKVKSPHFWDWAYEGVDCIYLPPATDAVKIAPLANPKKVLVVGAWGDSNTLYEWSERLAKSLGGTHHLRYDGAGHGTFMNGNSCVDDAVAVFLTDLKGPGAMATCAATPPDFRKLRRLGHKKGDFTPLAVRPRPTISRAQSSDSRSPGSH